MELLGGLCGGDGVVFVWFGGDGNLCGYLLFSVL